MSFEIPCIIGTSPHNALMMPWSVLVGMSVHVPGQLSRSSHSEWRCWSRCSSPFFWGGRNCGHSCIPWHSPTGTSKCPHIKSARIHFIKKHVENYNLQLECIIYLKTWACTKSTKQSTFSCYLQRLILYSEQTLHLPCIWVSNTFAIGKFLQWHKLVVLTMIQIGSF